MTAEKRCWLCGRPTDDYVVLPVPLSSPPQVNVICRECVEEILALHTKTRGSLHSLDPVGEETLPNAEKFGE